VSQNIGNRTSNASRMTIPIENGVVKSKRCRAPATFLRLVPRA